MDLTYIERYYGNSYTLNLEITEPDPKKLNQKPQL